jgi:hypothetical protein
MRVSGSSTTSSAAAALVLVGALASAAASAARAAEVVVDPRARLDIQRALADPLPLRKLDAARTQARLGQVDAFFAGYLDLDKATRMPDRHRAGTTNFRVPALAALPIRADPGREAPRGIDEAGQAWYTRFDVGRSYRTEWRRPAATVLPEAEAGRLAREFLGREGMAVLTEGDELGTPRVLTRTRRLVAGSPEGQRREVLAQRIEFGRIFRGAPVINSRQVVEIHPGTKELLAYRISSWPVVAGGAGEARPYRTLDEVVSDVRAAHAKAAGSFRLLGGRHGYLATREELVPVIALRVERKVPAATAVREIFTVPLVKGVSGGVREKSARVPERHSPP